MLTISLWKGKTVDSIMVADLKNIAEEEEEKKEQQEDDPSINKTTTMEEGSTATTEADQVRYAEKIGFQQACKYMKPGAVLRAVCYLYADRKLLIVLLVHAIATLITWGHYSLVKWLVLQEQLKDDNDSPADYQYWLKRICPCLAFGSKHAILLQMALIPLTMCRCSIAAVSACTDSTLDQFLPLNKVVEVHTRLGSTLVFATAVATIALLVHDCTRCATGETLYCNRLGSEIMITGLVIAGLIALVAITSYYRHLIPYEVFYNVHHLVFLMYLLAIIHTVDNIQRTHVKDRHQTYAWVTATLLYYVCDRAALRINHQYPRTQLVASCAISSDEGSGGTKTVLLKLRRPVLFDFRPGQYAYLRLPEIDNTWHPFSIASAPSDSELEFYIQVYDTNKKKPSWTRKLWTMMKQMDGASAACGEDFKSSGLKMDVDVMGPCGTGIAAQRTEDFSHVLAIGSNSGIVPFLSLYKQHVRNLVHLDPSEYHEQRKLHHQQMEAIERAASANKGSLVSKLALCCLDSGKREAVKAALRSESRKERIMNTIEKCEVFNDGGDIAATMKELRQAAFQATRSIYGVVVLSILTVIGVLLIGLTVSWDALAPSGLFSYPFMLPTIASLTILLQACFWIVVLFVWNFNSLVALTDLVICLALPVGDWFWCNQLSVNHLAPGHVALFGLLHAYITLRFWSVAVKRRRESRSSATSGVASSVLDQLHVVWVTRSAAQVSEIMPDILESYNKLASRWGGPLKAQEVCRFSIYVTDKDGGANQLLRQELLNTFFYRNGWIRFERPDFASIIENHCLDTICSLRSSYSLLAFCGSPVLGRVIHQSKIANDMVVAITGNKKHQMEFSADSYGTGAAAKPGGSKGKGKPKAPPPRLGLMKHKSTPLLFAARRMRHAAGLVDQSSTRPSDGDDHDEEEDSWEVTDDDGDDQPGKLGTQRAPPQRSLTHMHSVRYGVIAP